MGLCSEEKREDTVDIVGQIDLFLTIASQTTMYLVLITTTAILLFRRKSNQRPCLVILQVSLLWLSQFCFTSYNLLLAYQKTSVDQQTTIQNIVPTVGDLLFLIHDWLFTEQFVSAALFLPILLDGFSQSMKSDTASLESHSDRRERSAKVVLWSLRVFQYSMIAAWTILSLILGTLIIRMSLWVVQTLQTSIFAVSLCRLRALIAKVKPEQDTAQFTSNVKLMNWNLYIYIATILPFLFTFLVAYETAKDDTSDPTATTEACIDFIFVDASHFTVQLSNIPRAIISCYMNLQFAKTIESANQQFVVVFGENQRTVSTVFFAKEQERQDKAQAERRSRFYREYADRELSRIVVSLIRESGESRSHASQSLIEKDTNSLESVEEDQRRSRSLTYSQMFDDEKTIDEDQKMDMVMQNESMRLNSIFGQVSNRHGSSQLLHTNQSRDQSNKSQSLIEQHRINITETASSCTRSPSTIHIPGPLE